MFGLINWWNKNVVEPSEIEETKKLLDTVHIELVKFNLKLYKDEYQSKPIIENQPSTIVELKDFLQYLITNRRISEIDIEGCTLGFENDTIVSFILIKAALRHVLWTAQKNNIINKETLDTYFSEDSVYTAHIVQGHFGEDYDQSKVYYTFSIKGYFPDYVNARPDIVESSAFFNVCVGKVLPEESGNSV